MDGSEQPKKPRYVPFFSRTKAMSSGGPGGWEATTIGFTLVGCIGLCSFIGWWLDNRFGTSYWLPILFLVGAAAGFREMFVMLGRLNREEAEKKAAKAAKNRDLQAQTPIVAPETENKRIFKVPAPFGEEKNETDVPETTEELIARLLKDEDDGDLKK